MLKDRLYTFAAKSRERRAAQTVLADILVDLLKLTAPVLVYTADEAWQFLPAHLRDAHYRGAAALGHGEGYRYPHDHPGAYVEQAYLPEGLRGRRYYAPKDEGAEPQRSAWWAARRGPG